MTGMTEGRARRSVKFAVVAEARGGADIDKTANSQSARTGAWRALCRLADRKLIEYSRSGTKIKVTLLREDGTGIAYDRPKGDTEESQFLQSPTTFWTHGRDKKLSLPGLALFLVVAREKHWATFPAEWAPQWYGGSLTPTNAA
nr:hypothetical protein [Streptomyces sp. WAC04770]